MDKSSSVSSKENSSATGPDRQASSISSQDALFEYLSIHAVAETPLKKAESAADNKCGAPKPAFSSTSVEQACQIPIIRYISGPNIRMEESKSRAVRFLMKKSKRFCEAMHLTKPVAGNKSSKFQKLISSLKDSVKSTLQSGIPSSQTISGITNSLVSTLKGQRLPNCLHFLGFASPPPPPSSPSSSPSSSSSFSKSRGKTLRIYGFIPKPKSKTFVNWDRKPEPEPEGGHQFAKPEVYECSFCKTNICKQFYLKHIRRHRKCHICLTCSKHFKTIIDKRRHQLKCSRRAIL